jgi:DNA-binding MarR family transcriptional regulator
VDESPQAPDAEPIDVNSLGLLLKTAQHLNHQAIDQRLSRLGITLGHWAVLRSVARIPGGSGNELAAASFQTRQSLNEAVAKLSARGLIARDRGHGRRHAHHLTDEGRDLLERCNSATRAALEEGLAGLAEAERAVLRGMLRRIVENLIAARTHPSGDPQQDPGCGPPPPG